MSYNKNRYNAAQNSRKFWYQRIAQLIKESKEVQEFCIAQSELLKSIRRIAENSYDVYKDAVDFMDNVSSQELENCPDLQLIQSILNRLPDYTRHVVEEEAKKYEKEHGIGIKKVEVPDLTKDSPEFSNE